MEKIKEILFTHDDLDGAGCRILWEIAHRDINPEYWKVVNCSNKNVDDQVRSWLDSGDLDSNCNICFADIVCEREMFNRIKHEYVDIHVWDHHRSNFWVQTEYPAAEIIPENEMGVLQSGTSILYQYLCRAAESDPIGTLKYFKSDYENTDLIACFVDTVRSYDTYEWKQTGNLTAKKLQILFFLLGMERFCKRYVTNLTTTSQIFADTDESLKDSRVIEYIKNDVIPLDISARLFSETDLEFISSRLEMEQERIDAFTLDDIIDVNVRGLRTAFALNTVGMNVSELANQFLTKHPEFEMFVGFSMADGGQYSYRSIRDDLDIAALVAVPNGGGGHPKAAGSFVNKELMDYIADQLINELNGVRFPGIVP